MNTQVIMYLIVLGALRGSNGYFEETRRNTCEKDATKLRFLFCIEAQCNYFTLAENITTLRSKVAIIIPGWVPSDAKENPGRRDLVEVAKLVAGRISQEFDSIIFDWSSECMHLIKELPEAADGSLVAGQKLAAFLIEFKFLHESYSNYGIIGSGLGAHIAQVAITILKKTTWGKLEFVFGIDPLGLMFSTEFFVFGKPYMHSHLNKNSADRVTVLHCNPGTWGERKFGTPLASGHYDIYVADEVFDRYCSFDQNTEKVFKNECKHRMCFEYFLANMNKLDFYSDKNSDPVVSSTSKEKFAQESGRTVNTAVSWPQTYAGSIDYTGALQGGTTPPPGEYFARLHPWTYAPWWCRQSCCTSRGINVSEPQFWYFNPMDQDTADIEFNYNFINEHTGWLAQKRYRADLDIVCADMLARISQGTHIDKEIHYFQNEPHYPACQESEKLMEHAKFCETPNFRSPSIGKITECFQDPTCLQQTWKKLC